jgi:hypothetical protein
LESGTEYGADSKFIDDVFARAGSYIIGKRMFKEGENGNPGFEKSNTYYGD